MADQFSPWLAWIDSQYQEMLDTTISLANINSDSLNAAGVNRVGEMLAEYCQQTLEVPVAPVELAPLKQVLDNGEQQQLPLGKALRLSLRPQAPLRIFFCAHLDTVFAIDHPFQHCRWLDEETLNGPGVTDLKGGILVMIKALQAFERTPWSDQIGWEILFNPDEEIGSPGSSELITQAAQGCQLGMIYEPCFPDGNFAGARKGSGNFTVVVHGRAAHAGREHHLGRNAIRAMSDFVGALDDLNGRRPGLTVNPGFIQGGGAVNSVPDLCLCRFNVRLKQTGDDQWFQQQLDRLLADLNQRDGIQAELHGRFSRQPKIISSSNQRLLELAIDCGKQLGMKLDYLPTGGCCDGNNLSDLGVPNIDTLGVQGGAIHSSEEFLKVSSLTERAKLSALLLMRLANEPDLKWL
ncbi:MAG: hydrolase [Motiliproteus sp.]|nr:hydrolase [Motiliproteus sp.]MCW9051712.1 hydrolase [Motiliproteus sp.]